MFKLLRVVLGAFMGAALVVGCSSAPSMEQNAAIPTDADAICAVRHPCAQVPAPTPDETELCTAIFHDLAAECRSENTELFICSMRAARCDETGDIDDEATMSALMANCDTARLKLERCCETSGSGDDVHCGLFRDDGREPEGGDDDAVDDAGANDAGGDSVAPAEDDE